MRLLSVRGCRISTARSLTGERHETSVERAAPEDPPGFSIHESSTISGAWPLSPCDSNLPHNALDNYGRMQDVWLDK